MIKRFVFDDSGLETVEYAIVAGLIVIALVTVIATIGSKVYDRFSNLNSAM